MLISQLAVVILCNCRLWIRNNSHTNAANCAELVIPVNHYFLNWVIYSECDFTIADKVTLQSMCCESHTRARRCHSKACFQCVSRHEAAGVMLMQLPSNLTDCAFGTLPRYWKYIFCDKALFILTPHPIVTLLVVKSRLWRMQFEELAAMCEFYRLVLSGLRLLVMKF